MGQRGFTPFGIALSTQDMNGRSPIRRGVMRSVGRSRSGRKGFYEPRRIAADIAKLPELFKRRSQA